MNLLYHVPQAEHAAEEDNRKRMTQEMSRLQSTLEYLLLKGDLTGAQHEIAVLAHNRATAGNPVVADYDPTVAAGADFPIVTVAADNGRVRPGTRAAAQRCGSKASSC